MDELRAQIQEVIDRKQSVSDLWWLGTFLEAFIDDDIMPLIEQAKKNGLI